MIANPDPEATRDHSEPAQAKSAARATDWAAVARALRSAVQRAANTDWEEYEPRA